jgi:predicted Rossmann-fold nucleotide-binding protein
VLTVKMLPPQFKPFRERLYSFDELFEGFAQSNPRSFGRTLDFRIYRQYIAAGAFAPTDYFTALMEAVHDNAIREATQDYLRTASTKAAVAFMGGHDLARDHPIYSKVAFLAWELARRGFLPVSGGGPGAMEATHLGALHQHAARAELQRSVKELGRIPKLPAGLQQIVARNGRIDWALAKEAHAWLLPAVQIRHRIESPGESLAIPTWLYGHEPTTALATRVAKYFQNSVREDRLLSVATHGVIYVEGRAGTLQEIFQDAAQNYYRVLGDFSPMIFFGGRQWTKTLPVIAVLRKLFLPADFRKYVLVTDEADDILGFLVKFGRKETPLQRMVRRRRAER